MSHRDTGLMAQQRHDSRILIENAADLLGQQPLSAVALGINESALRNALNRADRQDLLERLRANRTDLNKSWQ
jgi:hypothetical protein